MSMSHFDEKSGIIKCKTPWGHWWQTVSEVSIQVDLTIHCPIKKNDLKIIMKPNFIECLFKGNQLLKGEPFRTIIVDESTWVIEEQKILYILLTKVDQPDVEVIWESLLKGDYTPSPLEALEMRKKLDLERFQLQNPGFDFSGAKLDKKYEDLSFDSETKPKECL